VKGTILDEHKETKRIFGLDIIRSFAILSVLIGHIGQHSNPPSWFKNLGGGAIVGVELFFVLSGFLIGGILLKLVENNQFRNFKNLLAFWKRRWLRTVPLYIIALLAFLRFDYHGWHPLTFHPEYWLFLQNFAWTLPDDFFTLSWSLAVEEHFYLWFPSLFLLNMYIFLSKKPAFYTSVLIFLAIPLLYRLLLPHMEWDEFNFNSRMVVLARLDAIMFGVLMAYIQQYHKTIWRKLSSLFPLWSLLIGILLVWYYNGMHGATSQFIQIVGMTLQAFLLSLLLPRFAQITLEPKHLFQKIVVLTSQISYSLYLGHILMIIFINRMLQTTGYYHTIYPYFYYLYPLYFISFYLLALLTYYTIERPFLDIRDSNLSVTILVKIIPFTIYCIYLVFFA